MRHYQFRRWLYWNVTRRLTQFGLFFYPPACNWHKGMEPENWDDYPPSCPECGCLLDTKQCPRCGQDFLDFGGNFWDDVMASPSVSSSGDLACCRCVSRLEENDEDSYNDSPEYEYDPYELDETSN